MSVPMVCPRDYVLRSRSGHTIRFTAGERVEVPDELVADALAVNIVPDERPDMDKPVFGFVQANITGTLRDALIFGAIHELVQRNSHEDFDGGGVPKIVAINAATGLSLGTQERQKYWGNYREMIGSNLPLPKHPNTELVLELQSLSSRKQLEEFAVAAGVDFAKLKAKPLKDIKQQLLSYVINQKPHVSMQEPGVAYTRTGKGTLEED